MCLQRQMQMAIILDHLLARPHGGRCASGSSPACDAREQRQIVLVAGLLKRLTAHKASRRLSPSELNASAWASFCNALGGRPVRSQRSRTESKPGRGQLSIFLPMSSEKPPIWRKPRRTCVVRMSPQHSACRGCRSPFARATGFQRAVPVRAVHVDGSHLDAMLLRVAHELRGRVKTHRLAVEQRRRNTSG